MSNEILDELAAEGPDQADLVDVSKLAALQVQREGEVDRISEELKAAKKELDAIAEKQLPEAMLNAGLKKFVTSDGIAVEIKEDLKISVPKKRKDEIIVKLRDEMDAEDLIANTLTVIIERGKDNLVAELIAEAERLGFTVERGEEVNSGSLKKLLKERRSEGINDDLNFFGAFDYKRATVTQ